MGCSDEERIDTIVEQASMIFNQAYLIEDAMKRDSCGTDDEITRICIDAKSIWSTIYGSYWFRRDIVDADIAYDAGDPLSAAVRQALAAYRRYDLEREMEKHMPSEGRELLLSHVFMVIQAEHAIGLVLELYTQVQKLLAALTYYNDKFMQRGQRLHALAASLLGQCYHVFRYNPVVIDCYLISDMCRLLARNDVFKQAMVKLCLDHDLGWMARRDTSVLVALHQELHDCMVKDECGYMRPTLDGCVKVFLKLAGRRFHHDHQYNGLKQLLSLECGKRNKVDWRAARLLFNECKRLYKVNDEEGQQAYEDINTSGHMTAIHGY